MNHTSKLTVLPALTTDLLQDSGILIDNVFRNTLAADRHEKHS